MRGSVRASIALICLATGVAPAQVVPENVGKLDEVLGRATRAVTKDDLSEAKRLVGVVLTEFGALPAPLPIGQVPSLQRLARLCLEKQLLAEADLLLAAAATTWEQSMAPGFLPLALVYADLAKARRLLGNASAADALLQRAVALRGSEPTQADPDAYLIFVEVAELRRQRADVEGAATLLRQMIAFADRMNGWEYVPSLIPVFESYGALMEQTGRKDEARQFRARASRIRANYPQPQ